MLRPGLAGDLACARAVALTPHPGEPLRGLRGSDVSRDLLVRAPSGPGSGWRGGAPGQELAGQDPRELSPPGEIPDQTREAGKLLFIPTYLASPLA